MTKMTPDDIAQYMADDLIAHLDEYFSLPETWDDELDRKINEWYSKAPKEFPKRPYFSPSSADACPREYNSRGQASADDGLKYGRLGNVLGAFAYHSCILRSSSSSNVSGSEKYSSRCAIKSSAIYCAISSGAIFVIYSPSFCGCVLYTTVWTTC